MKSLMFVTDIHLHPFNNFSKPDDDFINTRFRQQFETLDKVYDLARKSNSTIINGGDLFHVRNQIRIDIFNHIYKYFNKNDEVPIIHCVGNHDMKTNNLGSHHSLYPFKFINNTQVVDEPKMIEYDEVVDIYFLPFAKETDYLKEWLNKQELNKDKINILVGHLEVQGSLSDTGTSKLDGDFLYGDLRPNDFDIIYLGHYHKKQVLGDNPNHIYGGSLMQNNFGEGNNENGIYQLTYTSKEDMKFEFIPIESTKFVTLEGNINKEEVIKLSKDNYVRLRFNEEEIKDLDLEDIDLSNVQVEVDKSYARETRIDITEKSTEEDVVIAYIDEYLEGDKEIAKYALECLREAKSTND